MIFNFICNLCEIILSDCRYCTLFALTDSHSQLFISCSVHLRYAMNFEYFLNSIVSIFLTSCQIMSPDNWPRCQLARGAISHRIVSELIFLRNNSTELVSLMVERDETDTFRIWGDCWEYIVDIDTMMLFWWLIKLFHYLYRFCGWIWKRIDHFLWLLFLSGMSPLYREGGRGGRYSVNYSSDFGLKAELSVTLESVLNLFFLTGL